MPGDKSVVCYRPSPALFFTLSLSGYTSDLNPVKLCQHDYFTSFLLHFFASRLPVHQDFSERDKLALGGPHASRSKRFPQLDKSCELILRD